MNNNCVQGKILSMYVMNAKTKSYEQNDKLFLNAIDSLKTHSKKFSRHQWCLKASNALHFSMKIKTWLILTLRIKTFIVFYHGLDYDN